jgi:YebC/PmpR family DNA-binding regulatory protein
VVAVSLGKLFAKLARAVEVAARQGGGDPAGNATLATAITKARAAAMPTDNIERAIKRGVGADDGANYDEVWYEGYAPGGIALYVQILTDNRNRAASEVRAAFTRNMGEPGSVGYLFDKKGYLSVTGEEDNVMLAALEGGAEDVRASGAGFEVITAPSDLTRVQQALESAGLTVESAELTQLPRSIIPLDASTAGRVLRLVEVLEDLDDVSAVYANYDIDDDLLAKLAE